MAHFNETVSALYLILRWPLRHLGFYDMLLIVNRLLIKNVFFLLWCCLRVFCYYSPFYNRYCLRPFLQKYKSGFLSWIHFHRCFCSSKAFKKYLLSETWLIFFGTVFLHLAVHLKNKTKQNKTCNQGCLLCGKVWIDLIY